MTMPFHTPPLSAERAARMRQWLQTEAATALHDRRASARLAPAHLDPARLDPAAPAVAGGRPDHRRLSPTVRRLALGGAVAAAVTGAVILQPGGPGAPAGPTAAAAGVTFSSSEGALLAEITDPEASAAAMTAAFAERGLDIEVTLVPSTPELVGLVVMIADDQSGGTIEAVSPRPGCVHPGGAPCATAVLVSADFEGWGQVGIGRAPREGEAIVSG